MNGAASAPVVVKSATANSFYNVSEQSANFISPDNAAAFVNNRVIFTIFTFTIHYDLVLKKNNFNLKRRQ